MFLCVKIALKKCRSNAIWSITSSGELGPFDEWLYCYYQLLQFFKINKLATAFCENGLVPLLSCTASMMGSLTGPTSGFYFFLAYA